MLCTEALGFLGDSLTVSGLVSVLLEPAVESMCSLRNASSSLMSGTPLKSLEWCFHSSFSLLGSWVVAMEVRIAPAP